MTYLVIGKGRTLKRPVFRTAHTQHDAERMLLHLIEYEGNGVTYGTWHKDKEK